MPTPGSILGRLVGTVAGNRRGLTKFGFRLESPMLTSTKAFASASGLKMTTEVIKYRAGGSLIEIKAAGLTSFDDFTASRAAIVGKPGSDDLQIWKRLVTSPDYTGGEQGISGDVTDQFGAGQDSGYVSTLDVTEVGRDHFPKRRWRIVDGFPTEWAPCNGYDANTSEFIMVDTTWTYHYFLEVDASSGNRVSFTLAGNLGGVPFSLEKVTEVGGNRA